MQVYERCMYTCTCTCKTTCQQLELRTRSLPSASLASPTHTLHPVLQKGVDWFSRLANNYTYKILQLRFCDLTWLSVVLSPAPPSGWNERERRRVWEITQGRSVLKECCGQTTNGFSRFRRARMSTQECNTTRPAN